MDRECFNRTVPRNMATNFKLILLPILFFIAFWCEVARTEGSRTAPRPAQPVVSAADDDESDDASDEVGDDEGEEEEETAAPARPIQRAPAAVQVAPRSTAPAPVAKRPPIKVADEDEEEDEGGFTEAEGEAEEAKDQESPAAKQKMVDRLLSKLTLPNKQLASVVFLQPITYVDSKLSEVVLATMQKFLGRYGNFNISVKNTRLDTLTLEGFRSIMGKIKADVVLATVLKPTHFDIFIFDKRTPYYVFYHTEVHPEGDGGPVKVTEELAISQTKLLARRGLYLYLTNQFYELPRQNNREVVMDAQIPRWMASAATVEGINSEMSNDFYTAASIGGAISSASEGRTWAGGVIGFQFGARIWGPAYFEAAYQSFAYHAIMGIFRYTASNKYSSLQVMPGLGAGFVTGRKTLEQDRNLTLHKDYFYLVPSLAVWLPLGDLYFKAETMLQVSLTGEKFVFHFLPGLLVQF